MSTHQERVKNLVTNWASYNKSMHAMPLYTSGIWLVKGEDPNCDFGGSHHQPVLGYFEGTLEDVIHYAVDLPGWTTWGGGGDISLIKVQKVDFQSIIDRKRLEDEISNLTAKLEKLKKQL